MLQGFHHKLSYTWKPWGGNPGVHPEWYSSPWGDPFTSQMLGELPVQISKFSLQKRVTHPEDSWVPCPVNPLETLKATMKATNFTRLEGRAEPGLHGLFGFNGLRRVSRHCVAFPDVAERKRRGYLSDQQMTEQLTLEDVEMLRSLALRLADLQSGYPLI